MFFISIISGISIWPNVQDLNIAEHLAFVRKKRLLLTFSGLGNMYVQGASSEALMTL